MTEKESYNVVTDVVAGPNVRLKDNVVQGIVVFVCVLIGGRLTCAKHKRLAARVQSR